MRFSLLRLYLIITSDANWRFLTSDLGKPSCFSDCVLPLPDYFRSVSLAESSSCINRFRSFLSSMGGDVTILAWIGYWRFDCLQLNDDLSVFGLSVFFALGESGAPYKVAFLPFQMACSSGFSLLLTLEEYFLDVHDDMVSLVVRGWLWPFFLFSNDRCYHSFKLNFSPNFLFYCRKAFLYIYVHFDLVPKQVPWFTLKSTGLQLIYFWWLFGFLDYLIVVTKLFSVMEKGTSERVIEVFTIDTPNKEEAEPQRNGVTLQDELYNPAYIQRGYNKQAANPDGHYNQAVTQGNPQTLSPNDEHMECGILLCSSFLREVILLENGILFLDPIEPEINDLEGEVVEVEFLSDEEEAEPFEDPGEDVDEPIDTEPLSTIPDTDNYQMAPLFQEDEPLFTDEDFSALLNADTSFDPPNPDLSESTFHSIHNSMLSSSSMVNMLGGLEMNQNTITHSSSSKRKSNEGVEDTATSILMGFKKQRT